MSRDSLARKELLDEYSEKLDEIHSVVGQQIRRAWEHLPSDPVERAAFIEGMIRDMEATLGSDAHAVAVEFIRGRRALQGVGNVDDIVEPDLLSDAAVERMRQAVVDRVENNQDEEALKALLRACGNTVLNRARNTVKLSAEKVGNRWCRVPEEGACSFCLMLASRQDVYHTKSTALRNQKTGERYHANCRCTAVEVFEDGELPAMTQRVVELARRFGGSKEEWDEHKKSPEFIRYVWEHYIRDDPTRESRLGPFLSPHNSEYLDPRTAEERILPKLTLENLEINIFGGVLGKRQKLIGGHIFGVGYPKKSEFPPWWTSDDIIHATFLALQAPQYFSRGGDRCDCLREVHGVIVKASYYLVPGGESVYRHTVPLSGDGVFENSATGEDKGRSIPYDPSVLEAGRHRM